LAVGGDGGSQAIGAALDGRDHDVTGVEGADDGQRQHRHGDDERGLPEQRTHAHEWSH